MQISEVVNSMKDLIDYSRNTKTGPMGKFDVNFLSVKLLPLHTYATFVVSFPRWSGMLDLRNGAWENMVFMVILLYYHTNVVKCDFMRRIAIQYIRI